MEEILSPILHYETSYWQTLRTTLDTPPIDYISNLLGSLNKWLLWIFLY